MIKLSGNSLHSLLKLLRRKENVDLSNRPVFTQGEAIETEQGIDFTLKKSYYDYYNECVDNDDDIDLRSYTVTVSRNP